MQLTRRHALRLTGCAGVAAGLAACSPAASRTASTGDSVAMQLGWIKNVQFAGEYLAIENGHYAAAGLTVDLLAGGAAGTSTEAGIDTGKVWVGTSTPQKVAAAIEQGVPVRVIGATLATSPACITSPESAPLRTPKDLVGKRVGVADHNLPTFEALLVANGVDPSAVKVIPVQFDPSPLVNGEVDAWSGFTTNEPVSLRAKGFPTYSFLYGDFGLRMCAQVFVVSEQTLSTDRDRCKAFLTAEIKGWKDALADPDRGVALTVSKYGADQKLDTAHQRALLDATLPLIQTPDTLRDGLFTLSPSLIADTVTSLGRTGSEVTAAELFDTSMLSEVYAENPALR
ncbi:ABC transporter substrate-binding protein [Nocardia mangyaensis]|uniref:ABC transporter substrate-binding protein n=1 Tax=Nocardia mangyaensis TaxID=2213200 RepID=UPI002674D9C7|nr:ABC transporter substrate-binding protein [Nocardia mangyaensis]MDO3648104.1 ABC transporter substrate-binding protein [Nocardia mangyaensis]